MDPRQFDRTIDINLNGVWRTFRAALPHVKVRQGYLLAISSMAAFVLGPLNAHYAASKAGVWAMCDSLRLELKHLGVGVSTFHPTFFKTPMMEAIHADPGGSLVWNHHKGMWKFVELEKVVNALVECVERRLDLATVPKRNWFVACAPGMIRRVIEEIGMDDGRVSESVRLSNSPATLQAHRILQRANTPDVCSSTDPTHVSPQSASQTAHADRTASA